MLSLAPTPEGVGFRSLYVTVGTQNATEHLSKALFDCNDSTTFTITEDNITTRTLSTAVGCRR